MPKTSARRKGRTRGPRINGSGTADQRALELLQAVHGFGSLGFLLALSAVSREARARRK